MVNLICVGTAKNKSGFVCVFVGEGLCALPKHLEYKREGTETLPYESSLSLAPTNPNLFFTAPFVSRLNKFQIFKEFLIYTAQKK